MQETGFDHIDPTRVTKVVSARQLYHFLLTTTAPTNDGGPKQPPTNQSFPPEVIARIHEMADSGQYPIRGLGARRKLPTFDDLVFLTASVSRYPLEGYRERCETRTVLGDPSWRHAPLSWRSRSRSPA